MTSNTKISAFQKELLARDIADLQHNNFSVEFIHNTIFGITICIIVPFKGSNVKYVSTSVASPDEKKFRKSVGKFYSVTRFLTGSYVVIPANMQVGDE